MEDKENMEGEKQISSSEAQQALQRDREMRVSLCREEVLAALKKHRCGLIPVAVLRGNQMQQSIDFVAMD